MTTASTFVLQGIGGIFADGLVAAAAYSIAAVAALLLMHGIPLGSSGGPPSTSDVSIHLALAAAASCLGARVAVRIAGHRPQFHALGGLLGTSAFLGFSKPNPASNWPAWFPYGMAAACGFGAFLAIRSAIRRSSPGIETISR